MARKAKQATAKGGEAAPPMVITSIRIPPDTRTALVALAHREGTTVNYQVLAALADWLRRTK